MRLNPVVKDGQKRFFAGARFRQVPSFAEIDCGTTKIEKIPGVNELFKLSHSETDSLVRARGLEPPRPCGH